MTYQDGPLWKITSSCKGGGYVYCRTEPPHPRRNSKGLYPLHRVLMENKLGRQLGSDEVVHHEDENKNNNKISNLEVKTRSRHARDHARVTPLIECVCEQCGKVFMLKPHRKRLRESQNKTGMLFCSRSCGGKFSSKRRRGVEQSGGSSGS